MATPFGKPAFAYDYNLATEKRALNRFFAERGIPKMKKGVSVGSPWRDHASIRSRPKVFNSSRVH